MSQKAIAIVIGIGSGAGTGAAFARLLAQKGYHVALVSRGADSLKSLELEIQKDGGQASSHPIGSYSYQDVLSVFDTLPAGSLRVALYNAGISGPVVKDFLDITPDDVFKTTQSNVDGAFAFARGVVLRFIANELDDKGKKGTLIFTGATASLRGNRTTSAFSVGKFATRSLSQSLAKEFGPKENIHVAHVIIDGGILTAATKERFQDEVWEKDENKRLNPEDISESYWHLVNQRRSAWTWELDLRPAHEKW